MQITHRYTIKQYVYINFNSKYNNESMFDLRKFQNAAVHIWCP